MRLVTRSWCFFWVHARVVFWSSGRLPPGERVGHRNTHLSSLSFFLVSCQNCLSLQFDFKRSRFIAIFIFLFCNKHIILKTVQYTSSGLLTLFPCIIVLSKVCFIPSFSLVNYMLEFVAFVWTFFLFVWFSWSSCHSGFAYCLYLLYSSCKKPGR